MKSSLSRRDGHERAYEFPIMPRAKNSGALTEQQKLFGREYLVDRNATAAAIRAGYSAASANTNSAAA